MTDDATREHILGFIGSAGDQPARPGARALTVRPREASAAAAGMAIWSVLAAHVVELRRNEVIDDRAFAAISRSLYEATDATSDLPAGTLQATLEGSVDARLPESLKGAATLGLAREEWLATASRLVWREHALVFAQGLLSLLDSVHALADVHVVTIMPAFLDGRPVQPTTLAHFLGALSGPLATSATRLREGFARLNRCPLGAGLLAGDMLAADREVLAVRLGFAAPVPNTLDALASVEDVIETLDAMAAALAAIARFVTEIATWIRNDPTSFVLDEAWTALPEPAQPALVTGYRLDNLRLRLHASLDAIEGLRRNLRTTGYAPLGSANEYLLSQGTAMGVLGEAQDLMGSGLIVNRAYLGNRAGRGHTTTGDLAMFLMTEEEIPPVAARRIASLVLSRLRDANLEVSGITQDMIDSAALMTIGREIKVEMETLGRYLAPRRYIERRQVTGSPAPDMTRAWLAAEREARDREVAWLDGASSETRRATEVLRETIATAASEDRDD